MFRLQIIEGSDALHLIGFVYLVIIYLCYMSYRGALTLFLEKKQVLFWAISNAGIYHYLLNKSGKTMT